MERKSGCSLSVITGSTCRVSTRGLSLTLHVPIAATRCLRWLTHHPKQQVVTDTSTWCPWRLRWVEGVSLIIGIFYFYFSIFVLLKLVICTTKVGLGKIAKPKKLNYTPSFCWKFEMPFWKLLLFSFFCPSFSNLFFYWWFFLFLSSIIEFLFHLIRKMLINFVFL